MAKNGKTSDVPAGQNGAKPLVRFSDEELSEFEAILLERRKVAVFDRGTHEALAVDVDGNNTKDTSPGSIGYDDAPDVGAQYSNSELADRQSKYIKQIDQALFRIRVKTFGVCHCEVCKGNSLIQKERLKIVPTSTKCFNKIKCH